MIAAPGSVTRSRTLVPRAPVLFSLGSGGVGVGGARVGSGRLQGSGRLRSEQRRPAGTTSACDVVSFPFWDP